MCLGIFVNMFRHMRTTLELPDALLSRAKRIAKQRRLTLKVVIADALRRYLDEQPRSAKFSLPDKSFRGDGLVEGLSESDWDRIRELSYEGRGE